MSVECQTCMELKAEVERYRSMESNSLSAMDRNIGGDPQRDALVQRALRSVKARKRLSEFAPQLTDFQALRVVRRGQFTVALLWIDGLPAVGVAAKLDGDKEDQDLAAYIAVNRAVQHACEMRGAPTRN